MDTNYNEMEYENNIAKTLDSLTKEVEAINTPAVLSSEKLKNAGNNLYIDENGVLRVQPQGYAKVLSKHFGEFAKNSSVENVMSDVLASTFVQGA